MLHLVEEEKLVVEGAAAASLASFMSIPDILPELKEKTYVICLFIHKRQKRSTNYSSFCGSYQQSN